MGVHHPTAHPSRPFQGERHARTPLVTPVGACLIHKVQGAWACTTLPRTLQDLFNASAMHTRHSQPVSEDLLDFKARERAPLYRAR